MQKRVKPLLILSLIVLIVISLSSCSFIFRTKVKFFNLRANLPYGFVMTKQEGVVVAVHNNYPNVKDNIVFIINGKQNISDYTRGVIYTYLEKSINHIKDIEISEFQEIKISKKESLRIVVNYAVGREKIKQIMILIFDKHSTYSVTCTVLDKTYERSFEKMIDSIKIKWSIFY